MTANDEPTYTYRQVESYTVKANDGTSITTATGTGFGIAPEIAAQLPVGTDFVLETQNMSRVTGIFAHGRWVMRKSDQEIEREHEAWKEKWEQEKRDRLVTDCAKYEEEEAVLPDWIKYRLTHFHISGGEYFRLNGWGYELVIARLAVAYNESGGAESDEVNRIANEEGTSGNQHDVAKALARIHAESDDPSALAGTVSALTPITGDPFYKGES